MAAFPWSLVKDFLPMDDIASTFKTIISWVTRRNNANPLHALFLAPAKGGRDVGQDRLQNMDIVGNA
jgi:hypothetical protein